MTDDQQRPRSSLAVWLIVAILLPVLYVLSVGPMSLLGAKGYIDLRIGVVIYRPLRYASERNDTVHYALSRYQAWWQGQ